jgi:hypothetical protein
MMAAQISLILSILNLVLAAPIVVHEVHEARPDELVVVEDVAAMPKKPEWRKLEAIDLSPRASSDAMASPEEIASPNAWHLRSMGLHRKSLLVRAILPRLCRPIGRKKLYPICG